MNNSYHDNNECTIRQNILRELHTIWLVFTLKQYAELANQLRNSQEIKIHYKAMLLDFVHILYTAKRKEN